MFLHSEGSEDTTHEELCTVLHIRNRDYLEICRTYLVCALVRIIYSITS